MSELTFTVGALVGLGADADLPIRGAEGIVGAVVVAAALLH